MHTAETSSGYTSGTGDSNGTGASSRSPKRRLDVREYTVGWVCALPIEHAAAAMMLDEEHEDPPHSINEDNIYTLGRILSHNVVIVCLPAGLTGTASATAAAVEMKLKFPRIQFGLLVGVGGGVPIATDIRLGDVVVSEPHPQNTNGGVVQYDFGKRSHNGFFRTGFLNRPPQHLLDAVSKLKDNHIMGKNTVPNHLAAATSLPVFARQNAGEDILFKPTYIHVEGMTCENCSKEEIIQRVPRFGQDFVIHYGTIASGNSLIRDAQTRDRLSSQLGGVICFEMEAAGLMNHFPCLVIRAERSITTLHSDSIFLQQRLLVREDILSFLMGVFYEKGSVRVALHGLPGVGKSTMARHLAYRKGDKMAVLWITASSKETIIKGFKQYARQICGERRSLSQPVSIIHQFLSKHFDGRWLLILDGLDDPNVDIGQYIFNGLPNAKVLVTTRYTQVANRIGATCVLQINPLNEGKGTVLLSKYINPISTGENSALETELPREETDARIQLVHELGGLPLAISIIGAALRDRNDIPSTSCQAYFKWRAETQDDLLAQDPEFPDYSSSVRKAFTFAFQGILSGTESDQHAASMAFFIASCENASNTADYFQLYRQLPQSPGLENIDFLKDGSFELATCKLATINMVTWSWPSNRPPFIEMHSLVKRWIERIYSDRIHSYTVPKMRLLGLHMYNNMMTDQVRESQFTTLMDEIDNLAKQNPGTVYEGWDATPDILLPLLLSSQKELLRAISLVPVGITEIRRFSRFSKTLQSEMNAAYHSNLKDIDWEIFGHKFTKYIVCMANFFCKPRLEHPKIKGWGPTLGPELYSTETLDDCGLNAFTNGIPGHRAWAAIGHTSLIQDLKMAIMTEMERSIDAYLDPNVVNQAHETLTKRSDSAIHEWIETWILDAEEIIRRTLKKVFTEHCGAGDERKHAEHHQAMTSSWDPTKAFFVVLYRVAKAGAEDYLKSSRTIHAFGTQQSNCRDAWEPITRGGLGDKGQRVLDQFWDPTGSIRLERLGDYAAKLVTYLVADSLMKAAQAGFAKAFGRSCPQNPAERLASTVFSRFSVRDIFLSLDSDSLSKADCTGLDEAENPDNYDSGELSYIQLMDDAQECVIRAMKAAYGNYNQKVSMKGGGEGDGDDAKDLVKQAIHLTMECHAKLSNAIRAIEVKPYRDHDQTNWIETNNATARARAYCAFSFRRLMFCQTVIMMASGEVGGAEFPEVRQFGRENDLLEGEYIWLEGESRQLGEVDRRKEQVNKLLEKEREHLEAECRRLEEQNRRLRGGSTLQGRDRGDLLEAECRRLEERNRRLQEENKRLRGENTLIETLINLRE
ncbi:uncharacterized protein DFL_008487 [Arthrobotrys flagrans]|uniref:NB-ARC domain-containing protein n=1 Tax=Arthrobotrys flagrans TaxID=97331 RepID=A0A436ZP58_ARTFL|nr:hypothetical protein DFL_008487 [Arthrobotrys flagrans]